MHECTAQDVLKFNGKRLCRIRRMDITLLATPSSSPSLTKVLTTTATTPTLASESSDDNRKFDRKSKATVYLPTTTTITTTTSTMLVDTKTTSVNMKSKSKIFTDGGKCSSLIEVNRPECMSAVTGSVSSSEKDFHVVKIKISPENKLNISQDQQLSVLNNNSNRINTNNISNNNCDDILSSTVRVQSALPKEVKKSKVTIVSLRPKSSELLEKTEQMLDVNSFSHSMSKSSRTFLPINEESELNIVETEKTNNLSSSSTDNNCSVLKTIENSTKVNEMVQKSNGGVLEVNNPTYLYYMMTSGQCSPSDTLDSGTCSDMENSNNNTSNGTSLTPPPLPKKMGPKLKLHLKSAKMVQEIQNSKSDRDHNDRNHLSNHHNHSRTGSLTDSEESESSLSCDSLNSSECARSSMYAPSPPLAPITSKELNARPKHSILPDSLLRDIRDRKFIGFNNINKKITTNNFSKNYHNDNDRDDHHDHDDVVDNDDDGKNQICQTSFKAQINVMRSNNLPQLTPATVTTTPTATTTTSSLSPSSLLPTSFLQIRHDDYIRERNKTRIMITKNEDYNNISKINEKYENDKFYTFHLNEKDTSELVENVPKIMNDNDDETFAGFKDIHSSDSDTSTIRSSKGTVRGVKNRVRNGIATFLQMQQPNVKSYKEKDCGKVVLYTTSMGIVRETFAKCSNVKQILRTLLIKFEERDVFMSSEYQQEIRERMKSDDIRVPQLFVEGQHIGDSEIVERLNESGELRKMLKPYKSISATFTCQVCGGYRLLPCPSCNGSKKSVHRNHFTAEFVALKCMNCDEVGLVKCHNC